MSRNILQNRNLIIIFLIFAIAHFCFQLALHRIGIDKNVIFGDGGRYYGILRSLVIDKDLNFKNEYEKFDMGFKDVNAPTKAGYYGNIHGVGPAIFWSPFYLATHFLIKILNSIGANIPQDGYSYPHQYSAAFGTFLYVMLGLYLCLKMTKTFFDDKTSLLAVMSIFMASSLIYYTLFESSMAHGTSFFVIALLLYYVILYRKEERPLYWITTGFLCGLAFLVRFQNIAFLIFPAYFGFVYLVKAVKEADVRKVISLFRNVLLGAFALIIGAFPQLWFWRIIYGTFFPQQLTISPLVFSESKFFFNLFSSWQGIYIWTPITLLATLGLIYLFKRDKNITLVLILCFLFQIYITGVFTAATLKISWGPGHSFSSRWLINCTPIFILGLAALLHWLFSKFPSQKVYIKSLLIIFVVWNILFIIQYKLGFIPYCDYLSFEEIVLDKFTLPFKVLEYIQQLN